jgi:uncharacterized protein (TIGR03086 family)
VSVIAERWRRIAGGFTERAKAVPPGAWDNPSPCDGWLARDIVRHITEWMPALFFRSAGIDAPQIPPVDDDPLAAWHALDRAIQAALDDPAVAKREFDMRVGRYTVERAVDEFGTDDILIHTWDLARAAGLDERLDPDDAQAALASMLAVDEQLLRDSGHFGTRVDVPDDADAQTKLIAYTGRRP